MNNVFDEIFSSFPNTWGSDSRSESTIPPVNIFETADSFQIEVIAPGRSKEDFKINLEKGILTVSTEQKKEEDNKDVKILKKEFVSPSFKRSFSVNDKINTEAIQARYENGILYLVLPKKEEVKNAPKQIHIQ
ncbi:MAG TPA: Hsp20/alpha crystallin family protein [Segetibacter sp.]|jgi:HSP20 family protein